MDSNNSTSVSEALILGGFVDVQIKGDIIAASVPSFQKSVPLQRRKKVARKKYGL